MTENEHLWTILSEECAEVSVAISKLLRFGPTEVNVLKPDGPNNIERVVSELNDLIAMVGLLVNNGQIPVAWKSTDRILEKWVKVQEFMGYSKNLGAIETNEPV